MLIRELRYSEKNKLIVVKRSTSAANLALYVHSEYGSSCGPIILQLRDWMVKHREITLNAIKEK